MLSFVDPSDIVECSIFVVVPVRELFLVSHGLVHELQAQGTLGFEQFTLRALLLLAGQAYAGQ